jgi:hypothetical protein
MESERPRGAVWLLRSQICDGEGLRRLVEAMAEEIHF